jgi:transcription initiation factor TFIIIB Brf1 subunit/transcription initiation factor TFIIB
MIAWTSISTAKSNPAPAVEAVRALRDVLARWSAPGEDGNAVSEHVTAPVIYPDAVMSEVLRTFQSLAVVASESMQHQSLAEIIRSVAILYPRLPAAEQEQADEFTRRMLSALGDHVLTVELEDALQRLQSVLAIEGEADTASALAQAMEELGTSVGRLNSKSTRVPDSA